MILFIMLLLPGIILFSCNKKSQPASSNDSTAVKPLKKAVFKTPVPRVIVVNDKAARQSVDGRYYYDLNRHRYWRNNKDGKYYLFNNSMFSDSSFKKPVQQ
jgi:hypothetical protein